MTAPDRSPTPHTVRQHHTTRYDEHSAAMRTMAWNIRQIDRSGESWWYRRWRWEREGKWSR